LDFKNRFSFITFKNNIPHIKYPYLNLNDTFFEYFGKNYDDLK
jgi:hypothetical protein